jgi:2,4-dienoyl-CoA reductase-like NADH-dependent reductase (Old Yellow Enzyme family)
VPQIDRGLAPLFTPFAVKQLSLPNRFVMAPMTRKRSPGGIAGPSVAAYYRRRAENSVGLIVTEGTLIPHPAAAGDNDVPRFYGADALAAWRHVLEEVHAAGGRIVPQLWHVGMLRPRGVSPCGVPPIGPSGVVRHGQAVEPMSDTDVACVIDAFASAAGDAKRLGFDGVELHAAHGYLIDQFFWGVTNHRTDLYGGDIPQRTRFAVEIVKACRERVGEAFPILLRFSQWKLQDYAARLVTTPHELERFLSPLVDAGVDVFDCSTRRFWKPEFEHSDLNLAGWTRKISGRPVITVGAIWQQGDFLTLRQTDGGSTACRLRKAAVMVGEGHVDLVAVGRALLADPEWVVKIREGRADDVRAFSDQALAALA